MLQVRVLAGNKWHPQTGQFEEINKGTVSQGAGRVQRNRKLQCRVLVTSPRPDGATESSSHQEGQEFRDTANSSHTRVASHSPSPPGSRDGRGMGAPSLCVSFRSAPQSPEHDGEEDREPAGQIDVREKKDALHHSQPGYHS